MAIFFSNSNLIYFTSAYTYNSDSNSNFNFNLQFKFDYLCTLTPLLIVCTTIENAMFNELVAAQRGKPS